MNPLAIRAQNLSKVYRIGLNEQRHETLFGALMSFVKSPLSNFRELRKLSQFDSLEAEDVIWAVKEVSLDIRQGEVVGLIGRNGAGKSTLLKILSRITEPTRGRAEVYGRVGSLLEVGTGFHPDLTGRENVYLNGTILGMTKQEVDRKFDEIVEFSGVEKFIDTPVKRYSSGMRVRLAFAVAAHLDPEILIVDEVLSVGDLGFQRRCLDHMKRLAQREVTILLVSHHMFAIKAMCQRVLVMSQGGIEFDGDPGEAIRLYEKANEMGTDPWALKVIGADESEWKMVVHRIEVLDEQGAACGVFNYGQRLRVRLHYQVRQPVTQPNFCVGIKRSDDVHCCSYCAARDGLAPEMIAQDGQIELLAPPLKLAADLYTITVTVWDREFQNLYCGHFGPAFHVRHELCNKEFGVFHEPGEWHWCHHAS